MFPPLEKNGQAHVAITTLTKYKDVSPLHPEKGVNKLFQTVSCQGRIQNFLGGQAPNFNIFQAYLFRQS